VLQMMACTMLLIFSWLELGKAGIILERYDRVSASLEYPFPVTKRLQCSLIVTKRLQFSVPVTKRLQFFLTFLLLFLVDCQSCA
jgi:hypothetical protein